MHNASYFAYLTPDWHLVDLERNTEGILLKIFKNAGALAKMPKNKKRYFFLHKSEKSLQNIWRIDLNQLPLQRYPEYNLFTLKTNTY